MCFPYIIKRNFVAKTWTMDMDSVVVGFGYFSVVRQQFLSDVLH